MSSSSSICSLFSPPPCPYLEVAGQKVPGVRQRSRQLIWTNNFLLMEYDSFLFLSQRPSSRNMTLPRTFAPNMSLSSVTVKRPIECQFRKFTHHQFSFFFVMRFLAIKSWSKLLSMSEANSFIWQVIVQRISRSFANCQSVSRSRDMSYLSSECLTV